MNITTVKAGRDYRVQLDDHTYRFMLSADQEMVTVYTRTANLGSYYVSRFGGALTPAGIREFVASTSAMQGSHVMKAIIIRPDAVETVEFVGYQTIKAAVGGWIEAAHTGSDITLWCNEEGKLHGLPYNASATMLWRLLNPAVCDVLVGPVLVTGGATPAGETLGLNDEKIERIKGMVRYV